MHFVYFYLQILFPV